MTDASAKPNDFLHRYLLRPDLVRKVRGRAEDVRRKLTRSALGDIERLFPEPPEVVLDVGANIGYVTFDFHKAWPAARIWSFEPTPATFQQLQANVGHLDVVRCVAAAVAESDGTATLRVSDIHRGGSNSLLAHNAEFHNLSGEAEFTEVDVPTVRLDTFCAQEQVSHVGLLKLDIEGAEVRALQGADGLLADSAVDVAMVEYQVVPGFDDGPTLPDLIARFETRDYRLFGVYPFAESAVGQSLWGDAVFLGPAFRRRLLDLHGSRACGFTA